MVLTESFFDVLSIRAKTSPRLRTNLDLRNSSEDQSQRMLNAIEPGTELPIHRYKGSSETCICIRGHFEEYFYDEDGNLTDSIDMVPGGDVLNIEKGQWHSLKSLNRELSFLKLRMDLIICWRKTRCGKGEGYS